LLRLPKTNVAGLVIQSVTLAINNQQLQYRKTDTPKSLVIRYTGLMRVNLHASNSAATLYQKTNLQAGCDFSGEHLRLTINNSNTGIAYARFASVILYFGIGW